MGVFLLPMWFHFFSLHRKPLLDRATALAPQALPNRAKVLALNSPMHHNSMHDREAVLALQHPLHQ